MKPYALLLALAVATSSSGCVSYVAQQRAKKDRIEPKWVVLGLAGEIALGTLFGIGLHGSNEDHPEDTQIGTAGWIAIGNGVVFALDGIVGAVLAVSAGDP